jgi:hypothetical protein
MSYASLDDFLPRRRSSQRLGQYSIQATSQFYQPVDVYAQAAAINAQQIAADAAAKVLAQNQAQVQQQIKAQAARDPSSIPYLPSNQPLPKDTMGWYYLAQMGMQEIGNQVAREIVAERCPYWLPQLASYRPERGLGKLGFTNVRNLEGEYAALFYKINDIDSPTPGGTVTPGRLAAIRNVQNNYITKLKEVQKWSREDVVVQKAALDKTWWFNTQPWMKACRCVSPFPWTGPWISWMVGYMAGQKADPASAFPEPPRPPIGTDGEYSAYIQVMSRAFGIGFIPEPAANDSRYGVYKQAIWIVTHPPIGFFGMIGRFFKRFASIILTVVGAVLAPFTAGLSVIAVTIINSVRTTVAVLSAVKAAKAQASAGVAALQAEADKQMANVIAQIEKFYTDNPQWFLQHGMTPDKWITLTLDHKIEFITAGAEGRLPSGTEAVNLSAEDQEKLFKDQALAAQKAGLKPEDVLPAEVGGNVRAPAGSTPAPASTDAPMTYDVVVEGKNIGTYNTLDSANQAATVNTNRGDRFEIIAGGVPTGLQVRTAAGPVAIPPEAKAGVESVSKDKMLNVVSKAEQQVMKQGAPSGFPWWVLIAGGAAAVAVGH